MNVIKALFSHRGETGNTGLKIDLIWLTLAALLTLACAFWVDRPLARLIDRWMPPGGVVPESIPDLLALFVAGLSGFMVLLWLWTWAGGKRHTRLGRLSPLLAIGMPVAFGLKTFTKWFFGRTETRMFLSTRHSCDFCHWLHGYGPYTGFPSGHMLVMTLTLVLVCAAYPRLRPLANALLLLLAVALLLSSYHFLSDIIAGWGFGYVLARLMLRADTGLHGAITR
ncbi:MAG TPA: phosphatase PAP2 family protein [Gammaproteobacteria bacterium]|nr:phosphatase PAP2 family protein [Gammaproteobacteria bacterium]